MTIKAPVLAALCAACLTTACVHLGPSHLKADQVDYARALGDAKKREILAAIVGLRYGDAPAFLSVSSIIAAYQFDSTIGATGNVGSRSGPDPSIAPVSAPCSHPPPSTLSL